MLNEKSVGPNDVPEGACGREIVVGDRGIVVVIARCAEYGEVERFQVVWMIVQVVIVFVPVLIHRPIAQGDPVYRNVCTARRAFQIVGHFAQEWALRLAAVRNAPGQVHIQ